jgi:hypothetical protein
LGSVKTFRALSRHTFLISVETKVNKLVLKEIIKNWSIDSRLNRLIPKFQTVHSSLNNLYRDLKRINLDHNWSWLLRPPGLETHFLEWKGGGRNGNGKGNSRDSEQMIQKCHGQQTKFCVSLFSHLLLLLLLLIRMNV